MKLCSKCKREKELIEFNKNKRKLDGLQDYCKLCKKESDVKYYKKDPKIYNKRNILYYKQKLKLIEPILKNRECLKCKENRWWVIDFHHLDPNIKEFNISSKLNGLKLETLKNEINKCINLCANCHREFHHLEKINNITIEEYLTL